MLAAIAWVTVIDILATVAIPFVLKPSHAAHTALGTLLVALCVGAVFAAGKLLRKLDAVQAVRQLGKKRRWAFDLRVALVVLIGLCWIAREGRARAC